MLSQVKAIVLIPTFLVLLFHLIELTPIVEAAQPTFGAEFTFTNSQILQASNLHFNPTFAMNTQTSVDFQNRLINRILSICTDCVAEPRVADLSPENSIVNITFPDGFWITIFRDPGVIEVNMKPLTVPEIARNLERIQTMVFDAARAEGLYPHQQIGGGHIHLGFESSFRGDSLLVRNFIVDFFNHEGFARTLGYDQLNAQLLWDLPFDRRIRFLEIIEEWGKSSLILNDGLTRIKTYLELIRRRVYDWHPQKWEPSSKYKAINVDHILNYSDFARNRTLEIRSFLPQRSAYEYYLLTYILEGRLMKLRTIKDPIPLRNIDLFYRPLQGVEDFAKYVSESGVDLEEMKRVFRLDPHHRDLLRYVSRPSTVLFCDRIYRNF